MTKNDPLAHSNFIKCQCNQCQEHLAFEFLDKYGHLSLRESAQIMNLGSQQVLQIWSIVKMHYDKWEALRKNPPEGL